MSRTNWTDYLDWLLVLFMQPKFWLFCFLMVITPLASWWLGCRMWEFYQALKHDRKWKK